MMMKKLISVGLVSLLSLTSIAVPLLAEDLDTTTTEVEKGHRKDKKTKEEVSLPENAISKDEAKEKVLKDVNLSLEQVGKVKSRVSTNEDGTVIYKVSFKYENQKYKYQVDALTGNILDKTFEEINNVPA